MERLPKPVMWVIILAIALAFAFLDYRTGAEISFAVFYLVPVMLAAWNIGKLGGFFTSLLSALLWMTANFLAGERLSSPLIYFWNATTRAGFFITVTFLLAEIRHQLTVERALAQVDPLTNTLNRRAFYQALTAEISRLQRYEHPFTIVYLDLDNFKTINDRFGHSTGDRLLREISALIQRSIRDIDVLARVGGDEFILLLPETGQKAAHSFMPRLQQALAQEMARNQWNVTFSIGVLTCTRPPASVDDVISSADRLMYEVKMRSKNAIAYSADIVD